LSKSRGLDVDAVVDHLVASLPRHLQCRVVAALGSSTPPSAHDAVRLALAPLLRSGIGAVDGLPLHAACCRVDFPDQGQLGLLLPGRSRSGKSTLAALFAHHLSAAVVSDDITWLDHDVGQGVRAPIALRPDNPLWPIASALWYAESPTERLLVLPEDLGGSSSRTSRIDAVVFPEWGTDIGRTQVSAAASFCRLCANLMSPTDRSSLLRLAEFATRVPAHSIGYATSVEALSLFDATLQADDLEPPVSASLMTDDELANFRYEVWGIRFGEDEVALFNPTVNQVVRLAGWPKGVQTAITSWSALAAGTTTS